MIKYDFKRILLPISIRLFIAIIMTLIFGVIRSINIEGYDLNEWFVTFGLIFWVVIFWIANYLGSVAFKNELMDDAYEYMMTFPYSKKKLVFYKMVPGLTVLGVLSFIFQVINFAFIRDAVHLSENLKWTRNFLTDPIYFTLIVMFIYFNAFAHCSFSPRKGQFGLNLYVFGWFVIMPRGFDLIIGQVPWMKSMYILNSGIAVTAMFILIVLGTAFVLTFRRFDARGMNFHWRRFMLYGPLYLIILGTILMVIQFNS